MFPDLVIRTSHQIGQTKTIAVGIFRPDAASGHWCREDRQDTFVNDGRTFTLPVPGPKPGAPEEPIVVRRCCRYLSGQGAYPLWSVPGRHKDGRSTPALPDVVTGSNAPASPRDGLLSAPSDQSVILPAAQRISGFGGGIMEKKSRTDGFQEKPRRNCMEIRSRIRAAKAAGSVTFSSGPKDKILISSSVSSSFRY